MRPRHLLVLALLVAALAAGYAGRPLIEARLGQPLAAPAPATHAPKYQCSMHPQIVSDHPGTCPICQMPLTLVDDGTHAVPTAAAGARTPIFYRDPMRADVTSPVPAKDEMGMDYIPVYADDTAGAAGAESDVAGHAGFTLSHERQQLIGVRRGRVERRPLSRDIRAVGTVAYDPQLYQAISDYRQALAGRARLHEEALAEAREGSDAIARAAMLRLRQLGLSEAQVRDIGRGGGDPGALLLPGATAWIYAQVYEYEIDAVRPGQEVTVSVPSQADRPYRGTVAAIDPILDTTTRTARVRVQVATPDGGLRPQSFVTALIHVPTVDVVAVPSDAILDTGRDQFVFVVENGTRFTPRAVRVGRETGGWTEIIAGVEPGAEVVTSANFLIDSESRFRAAVAAFSPLPQGEGQGEGMNTRAKRATDASASGAGTGSTTPEVGPPHPGPLPAGEGR
ncbi:MAG TPA: efflux RND transporter periplasmic adaptor subunit [Candidatus Dormibacteraeota bacterium]|nr:efflux RND transporter periplasmic adaptor subunit [Candidatus Dormibacteraeota bacterium]